MLPNEVRPRPGAGTPYGLGAPTLTLTKGQAMPDLTQPDPVDVGLRVLLTEPSYAAQVLIIFARVLEIDAREEMTGLVRERGIDIAADTILRTLPDVVARESLARVYNAMPALTLDATRGQYALLVRTAARDLG